MLTYKAPNVMEFQNRPIAKHYFSRYLTVLVMCID